MIILDANVPSALMQQQLDIWVVGRRATLATRNTRHFDDLTTPVVNPWAES
jgi:hypothetical protein